MHEHGKGRVDKQGVGDWEPAAGLERPDDAYFGLVARSVKRELPDGLLDFQWEVVERHLCARCFEDSWIMGDGRAPAGVGRLWELIRRSRILLGP